MTPSAPCPQCGAPLPPDAPEGICPKCLVQLGLGIQAFGQPDRGSDETTPPTPRGFVFTPPAPNDLAEHFPQLEILELIGHGGMGAVYKARQRELDRLVALKILPPSAAEDPAFAERFSREARTLARMNHPHIVAVHDVGRSGGLYYFVMEYVDGVNLRQAIQAKTLSPPDALAVVRQICDALEYAHSLGIVHRDIKPENVLIDKQGRVKIADFGLAKLLGKAPSDITLTQAHQAMGTPHYMAPEQMLRPLEVDHRADIYSLGVVFYELLTGELPLGRFDPPSRRVQVDVRLDEIVLRTLEREPDRRYQAVSEVRTEIDTVSRTAPPATIPAKPAASLPDRVMRRRLSIGLLVEFTLAQAALIALTWGYMSDAEWYFEEKPPYAMLTSWWAGMTIVGVLHLAWWWYLYAKDSGTPRSFQDFIRVWQTPDPRMKKVAVSVVAFFVPWLAAVGIAFVVTPDDDVHTVVYTSGILLGPYVAMAAIWLGYGSSQRPKGAGARVSATRSDGQSSGGLEWPGWWRSRPRWLQISVHVLIALVYLIVLLLFFGFEGSRRPDEHRFEIGQPTPWVSTHQKGTEFDWSLSLGWPVVAAVVGLAVLALDGALTRIEREREYSLRIHFAVWAFLLCFVCGLGLYSFYLHAQRLPVDRPATAQAERGAVMAAASVPAVLFLVGAVALVWLGIQAVLSRARAGERQPEEFSDQSKTIRKESESRSA